MGLDIKKDFAISWGWRGNMDSREQTLKNLLHLIGNEHNTKFWPDPWLPCDHLLEWFGEDPISELGLGRYIRVSYFVSKDCWTTPQALHHNSRIFPNLF
ncbi:hypothetical protein MRB53_024943 [Persea americana]|uniref:Uncharacterized protein n=1 Tax=Persea americana TaxID=3435 RepID=A0ACC2LDV1_PERAE|nr:hypothetical protein MRB53_024943 [Persea americana]